MKKSSTILQLTPPQVLVLGFAAIIMIGTFLLSLPLASKDGLPTPFIDALFTATSATCVTGLVVVDTGTHFTMFGQIIIVILIQIGGLGFMSMSTLFALVLRKRITLRERLVLQEALNQGSMEGIVRLFRKVLVYSLIIEAIAAVLFTIRWSFDLDFQTALFFGIWHAISFFNNAGFDLFGSITGPFSSLTAYADDFMTNVIAMALIVLGGIGFVVLSDLLEYKNKKKLSLHSKVVLSMTAFLIIFGAIVIFIFEYTNTKTLGSINFGGKVLASFFQSVSPRTAGANSLDIGGLRQATQFFIIILMFIGASPGSTGGGIKTTTFTVLVGAMLAMIRGKEDIVFFRFRLAKDRIFKAITLTMLALFLVILVAMLLSTTESAPFLTILFEVTSAFGTVGLSMGLTPELTMIGKILISITMFAGRLGPITLAYALQPKKEKELYKYPEGKITIG
ncbi:TrkH family potassium uptake protein [Paenibacillus eucommiae]|uniref:Trk system potassium uptake protein TrkH n=1 Tax=Paenibacillus eucommiae TaxID=1355755 RepID=A0ABS4IYD7_9BACL|nr:TrkH family potassium uptake protein [Paenibacillus eucommiae]MBP1991996.1 trk system potassium uptake protein TrkH [Paenibacillus eucommiae]